MAVQICPWLDMMPMCDQLTAGCHGHDVRCSGSSAREGNLVHQWVLD